MTTTTDQELRIFIPGTLWTTNSERSNVMWQHRRNTDALRKSATPVFEACGHPPFAGPVMISAWPRTFTGKGDCGAHAPALKAIVDSAVTAGILPEDDPKWVRCIAYYLPRKVAHKDTGMFISIRPLETD